MSTDDSHDLLAVHAIGGTDAREAEWLEWITSTNPTTRTTLAGYQQIVAALDQMITPPLPRPEVWDRINDSLS